MRRTVVSSLVVAVVSVALAAPAAVAAPSTGKPGPGSPSGKATGTALPHVPLQGRQAPRAIRTEQEVVVRTRAVAAASVRVQAAGVRAAAVALGARPGARADRLRAQSFSVPLADVARVVAALRARPDVVSVETPVPSRFFDVPNDTFYASAQKTYFDQVNAPAAWAKTKGDAGVLVAVVDSGVDVSHPDLAGKIVDSYNAWDGSTDVSDEIGHGTAVAGVAAAATNNAVGIAGSGWSTRILAVKVADPTGALPDPTIATGIEWAADHNADVINLSLGSPTTSTVISDAVAYARAAGAVVVAAAGNSGLDGNPVEYPAAYPGVIAVGATDPWAATPTRASFSEYGPWVSVGAPGVQMAATCSSQATLMPDFYLAQQCLDAGKYLAVDGTSFASPFVAGEIALLKAANPTATAAELRAAVIGSAHGYAGLGLGAGLVDFDAALARLAPSTVPVLADPSTAGTVRGDVALSATSTAPKVRFTLDGAALGAPVAVVGGTATRPWSSYGVTGAHVLGAVDCSLADACSATASTVSVTVDNGAPVVTAPISGSALSGPFTISADAPGGGVRFYVDGTLIGFDGTAPYSVDTIASQVDGLHTITARQCDAAGTVCLGAVSAGVPVTTSSLHPRIVSVAPSPFSPNGDGRKDTAVATVSLPETDTAWYRILRGDGSALTVWHRIGVWSAGTHVLTVSGKDDAGVRLPDGRYAVELLTRAAVGGVTKYGAAARSFAVDSTGPLLTGLTASGGTFYPVKDGYRDSFGPTATIDEPATVTLLVTNSAGATMLSRSVVRTTAGKVAIGWNGRYANGSLVPAGTYKWRFLAQDTAGNRRYSAVATVKVSWAKLVTRSSVVSVWGNTSSASGGTDPACAGASTSQSDYPYGIWLYNECDPSVGEQALALWEVTLPAAIRYTTLTLSAYGYSYYAPSTLIGGFYDYTTGQLVQSGGANLWGTSELWVPLGSASAAGRVSGRTATLAAAVPNGSPTSFGPWDFDVSAVKVVVTYLVLG